MKSNDEFVNGKPFFRCTIYMRKSATVFNSNRGIGYLTEPDSVTIFSFNEIISVKIKTTIATIITIIIICNSSKLKCFLSHYETCLWPLAGIFFKTK